MPQDRARPEPFIGLGGLVVALFLYAYLAIRFPGVLHSVLMPLLWLVLFLLACRWFTSRPRTVLVLPVVAVAAWFLLLLT